MLFSSIPFLYWFFPAVLLCYFGLTLGCQALFGKKVGLVVGNTVLLTFSLMFYGWGEPRLLGLMVFTILLFYVCGLLIGACKSKGWKRVWLIVSIVISVTLLGLFKYADFFIESLNGLSGGIASVIKSILIPVLDLFRFADPLIEKINSITGLSIPLLKLALPVGISFYTFQCLSYTIDVYRGNVESQKNPLSFGAYVALFPQLIAGPIVRYVDIVRELGDREHTWDNVALGLRRFIVGVSKKILIADSLALLMKVFRMSSDKSLLFYWIYAISFTLYIYFDFSGYSDMGIGLGRVFGFKFIENFDHPYMSRSVTEFWRRWHMSLGSWFRDYIYIPLGGNRVGKLRWVMNILAVWMLTGLWHGADWTYVIWGLMFAVLLLVEKWTGFTKKAPAAVGHIWTMFWVILSFVLFSGSNSAKTIFEETAKMVAPITIAFGDLKGIFGFGGVPLVTTETLYYLRSFAVLLIVAIVGCTPLVRNLANRISKYRIVAVLEPLVLLALLLICTGYLVDGSFSPFLYFQF